MPPNLTGRLLMTMTKLYLSKQLLNPEILSYTIYTCFVMLALTMDWDIKLNINQTFSLLYNKLGTCHLFSLNGKRTTNKKRRCFHLNCSRCVVLRLFFFGLLDYVNSFGLFDCSSGLQFSDVIYRRVVLSSLLFFPLVDYVNSFGLFGCTSGLQFSDG